MVELVVAIAIIGLAVGPLILLLSSSNKANKASIYEEMATHYTRELASQFLRMDGDIAQLVNDAKIVAGSSVTFKSLIDNSGFQSGLSDTTKTGPYCVPFQISSNKLKYRIILSPLIQPAFKSRTVSVTKMNTGSNSVLKVGNFWKMTIKISWVDPKSGRSTPKVLTTDVVLHEI